MRIISGEYKGRRIIPPSNINIRPTTDMAKEALFNILNNIICYEDIKALDLFAGFGNISFELISRGCNSVLAVDKDIDCVKFIRKEAEKFGMDGITTIHDDSFKFLKKLKTKFDLIFADPPYDNPDISTLPQLIFDNSLLNNEGLFILEHPKFCKLDTYPNFFDHRIYGRVNFSFFKANINCQ